MKAIRIHEPTGINGLVYEEVPDATPGLCDVLVKVAACGITHNELDWPIWTCRAGHQRTSIIPGHEVSGVVAVLGYGTAGIAVGDEVFGLTDQVRDGAAAEYVAAEADLVLERTVGEVLAAAPGFLRRGGTLATIRGAGQPPASRDDIGTVVFVQASSRARLPDLARLVDEGHLRPQVGAVYPLA